METESLTTFIKQKALELGFDKVGIISAQPVPQDTAEHLRQWLALGYQADMQWMATHLDKRLDPATLMPGARSMVCVAMNYYTPDAYDAADPEALKIAKYARGTDYHHVLKERLKTLLAAIQREVPDIHGRALTDSAPILEKPLAVQAGLGWIGKNGNLITPDQGSWLFLGELLLDVALIPDTQVVPDHCGVCRRCMDACPTGAIVEKPESLASGEGGHDDDSHALGVREREWRGVIDANRCISYWTIEHKGEAFPAAIAHNVNGWIFGCDICQDVCPWNLKFARATQEEAFIPRPLNRQPDAETLLALDEDQFRIHYRQSPVKRAKLSGLKRNIKLAAPDIRNT